MDGNEQGSKPERVTISSPLPRTSAHGRDNGVCDGSKAVLVIGTAVGVPWMRGDSSH